LKQTDVSATYVSTARKRTIKEAHRRVRTLAFFLFPVYAGVMHMAQVITKDRRGSRSSSYKRKGPLTYLACLNMSSEIASANVSSKGYRIRAELQERDSRAAEAAHSVEI
jgi:hypothetical protein